MIFSYLLLQKQYYYKLSDVKQPIDYITASGHSLAGSQETIIKVSARAGSSENLPEERSASKLTWLLAALCFLQALGLRTTVSSGCHPEVTPRALLHGCPHWEARNMESCFFKTSKGQCPRARQLLQF